MLGKEPIGHGDLERFHIGHRPRPLRDTAALQACRPLTPSLTRFLYRVWQLLIHRLTMKQRSRRRIQLFRSLRIVSVSISLNYPIQPRRNTLSSSMAWTRVMPRDRLVIPLIRSLKRIKDVSVSLIFRFFPEVKPNPRNPRSWYRATALFARLTRSFNLLRRKLSMDPNTRSPARCEFTYTFASSAYRQNRCPLRSNSLSNSSRRILLSSGDKGPPWGVPSTAPARPR